MKQLISLAATFSSTEKSFRIGLLRPMSAPKLFIVGTRVWCAVAVAAMRITV